MGISVHAPVKVLDAEELTFSDERVWEEPLADAYRITLYTVFTGYTAVTVKLQATIDGSNWMDVDPFLLTTSNSAVSGEIGPFLKIAINITATVSVGGDTIKIYLQRTRLP